MQQVSVSGGDNFTKLKTRRTKEEREALKAAKEEEKKRKALEKEVARSTKPGECMKVSFFFSCMLITLHL